MGRSIARECQAPGTTVAPGEVLVATEIGDPARGLLPCPAAPLIGGVLQRRGIPVRYAPVPHCAETSQEDDGAVLFVTTALQRQGEATAIGAAANRVDAVSAAAARAAVDEWSAVVGTRRLLGAVSPWCDGARRAMEQARKAVVHADGPLYIYGHLAGTPQARAELAEAGAVFTTSLPDPPNGGALFIPAHGTALSVLAEARQRGLDIIDATCPLVHGVHEEVRQFAERGDHVVVIGSPDHAVAPGILGQAPERTVVVGAPADASRVGAADPRRVSYVLEPGIPVEETSTVSTALRSRFPALRGPDPDRFCYAASDRAETVRVVAAAADLVLVLGAEDDADTRRLSAMARACHARAYVIAEPGDILPSWLTGVAAIGLAESTVARRGLAGDVTTALSGLGPLSVTHRRVTTEIT
jgi:4-hydroxy-3-methylbut-2-en-1-yl diphosphate reductase